MSVYWDRPEVIGARSERRECALFLCAPGVLSVFNPQCPKLNLEVSKFRSETIRPRRRLYRQEHFPRANAELAMCEKCKELDQRIEHYRRLSQSITDQPTIDRFKEAIGDLFDQKLALQTVPAEPRIWALALASQSLNGRIEQILHLLD
jgi:hypothetical protein